MVATALIQLNSNLDDDIIEITEIVQSISNTELPADKLNYPPNNVTFCSGNTE